MWLRVTLLVLFLFLRQYLHCSGIVRARDSLMSVPFHRCVARGRGRRRGPRKSIYLFIYVPRGGARPDEGVRDAAYSRRMHRTGNPTGAPARDEGMAKVTGILDSAVSGARFSPFEIYTVFIYLCIFPVKEYKMRLLYDQNLNNMNFKDMKITFLFLFDRIQSVVLLHTFLYIVFV